MFASVVSLPESPGPYPENPMRNASGKPAEINAVRLPILGIQ
jgi:hypothetical protein